MKLPEAFRGLRRSKIKEESLKDDIPSRGKYGPLDTISDAPRVKGRKFLQIVPTVALLLAGIALMLAHHFFYLYLDSKIIDSVASELPPILRDQTAPHTIGTLIAHGACAALSMVVGSTFAQLFWEKLRTCRHSIQQIDALAQSGQGSFHSAMFRTMTAAPLLFLVSLVVASMNLIVVFSRGSLTVTSELQRWEPCLIPTVPDFITEEVNGDTSPIFENILATGTYIPPFRADVCAKGALSCSYNVSFTGPTFVCVDVSSQTDFATSLNSSAAFTSSDAPYVIWNGTFDSSHSSILISTWDLLNNIMQANYCTVYEATYTVGITGDMQSVEARVWDLKPILSGVTTFMELYVNNAMDSLKVTLCAGPNGVLEASFSIFGSEDYYDSLLNSKIFVTTSSGNHTWSDNMTNVLTTYMQNASISLLSEDLNNIVNATSQKLIYVNSSCISTWDAYTYSPIRLLSAYGIALTFAIFVGLPGIILALRNGVEEVMLSHIIQFALNSQLRHAPDNTAERTEPRTGECASDYLVNDALSEIESNSVLELRLSLQNTDKELSTPLTKLLGDAISTQKGLKTKLQSHPIQMILFTSCGTFAMVALHLCYSFLNTKSPANPKAQWITSQSVVSDIGIAIASAGQFFFAASIALSSSQLFWCIMRRHGHKIAQIDALMKTQQSPFSLSLSRCTRASLPLVVATFISASMPLISTFAPNSIKLTLNQVQSTGCTVKAPNLTSLRTSSLSDFSQPLDKVFQSGTYLAPENLCSAGVGSQCSYSIQFVGPGFACSDETASSNYTAFKDADLSGSGPNINAVNVWSSTLAVDSVNRTMRLSVETWDVEESVYRALRCAGVTRSYSLMITHNTTSSIEVISSNLLSPVQMDPGVNLSISLDLSASSRASSSGGFDGGTMNGSVAFMQQYLLYTMAMLEGSYVCVAENGVLEGIPDFSRLFYYPSILYSRVGDSRNLSFDKNMPEDLELFAQNATLSLLSGSIFAQNDSSGFELLEDYRTTCNYILTAYKYSPSILFTTYGIPIILTVFCMIGGVYAIKLNGVDETMHFSRFLHAVSNERMFNARERIEVETVIKADNDIDGSFAPFLESDI